MKSAENGYRHGGTGGEQNKNGEIGFMTVRNETHVSPPPPEFLIIALISRLHSLTCFADIPSEPDQYYGRLGQWISWDHFLLGTEAVRDNITERKKKGDDGEEHAFE